MQDLFDLELEAKNKQGYQKGSIVHCIKQVANVEKEQQPQTDNESCHIDETARSNFAKLLLHLAWKGVEQPANESSVDCYKAREDCLIKDIVEKKDLLWSPRNHCQNLGLDNSECHKDCHSKCRSVAGIIETSD